MFFDRNVKANYDKWIHLSWTDLILYNCKFERYYRKAPIARRLTKNAVFGYSITDTVRGPDRREKYYQ